MANAYKCDRCGMYFNDYKGMREYPVIATKYSGRYTWADLCEKCKADLDLFMQNAPVLVNKEDTLYADGVPVNRPMTCREKLAIEHPQLVDDMYYGGCAECPHFFDYAKRPDDCNATNERCTECWDRPVEVKE